MNHNKTLITVIGLFLGSWFMICEPSTCGANENLIKDTVTFEDSNLMRSAVGEIRVEAPGANRRLAQNSPNNQQSADGLTLEKLRNAEYKSTRYGDNTLKNLRAGERKFDPSGNRAVRLKDGYHETRLYPDSETKAYIELTGQMAWGDLNGDGVQDAVVILLSSGGGSGGFFELAAMVNQSGTAKQAALQYLGDRVDIKSVAIKSGIIVIDMLTHGPDDGQCCPSVPVTRKYRLQGGNLQPLP